MLNSGSEGDSDSDREMPETREEAREELAAMTAAVATTKGDHSGLFAMKFMQDGLARKKAEAEEALADLEAELDSASDAEPEPESTGRRVVGQRRRGAAAVVAAAEPKPGAVFEADEDWGEADAPAANIKATKVDAAISIVMPKSAKASGKTMTTRAAARATASEEVAAADAEMAPAAAPAASATGASTADGGSDSEEDNPWLAASKSTSGLTPQVAMNKFTKKADKRMAKLQRAAHSGTEDPSATSAPSVVKLDVMNTPEESRAATAGPEEEGDAEDAAASGAGFKLNSVDPKTFPCPSVCGMAIEPAYIRGLCCREGPTTSGR